MERWTVGEEALERSGVSEFDEGGDERGAGTVLSIVQVGVLTPECPWPRSLI